jgi:anti-anti-sigma regulatory factor
MLGGVPTPPPGVARWESTDDGVRRVVIAGDVDFSAHDRLVTLLWTRTPGSDPRVEIDLGGVGFFDTSIARVLERYRTEAAHHEAEVRVVNPSRIPLLVLRLAGLSALLTP